MKSASPSANSAKGANPAFDASQGLSPAQVAPNVASAADANSASAASQGKDAAPSLGQIAESVRACHACALCETRTNAVVGAGDPHARVMIVGEAPGKNEDATGTPFVGAAGKLLDELLEHAGLERSQVYIANVLKCRPPGNRDPRPEEIQACADYLREQTRAIEPLVIVTLGNFATQFILKTGIGITKLRGTIQHAGRFTVLPVFHPAAAIYDRSKKDALVSDFEQVGQIVRDRISAETR